MHLCNTLSPSTISLSFPILILSVILPLPMDAPMFCLFHVFLILH